MMRIGSMLLLLCVWVPRLLAASVSYTNGIFLMAPDEHVAAGHHPLDLLGRTLRARRIDGDRFEISNVPLQYRETGPLLKSIFREDNPSYAQYALRNFAFPFGRAQQTNLYLSAFGGIYFSTPPAPATKQHSSAASAIINPVAVIAPLLLPKITRMSFAAIYVREEAAAVTVTWMLTSDVSSDPPGARFKGEMQAVLSANGDIDFNYKSFDRFLGGAPVITTGAEPFRAERHAIASMNDAAGDVEGDTAPDPAGIYDLRSMEISRVSDVDLVEIRATIAQPVDPAQIPGNDDTLLTLLVTITPRNGDPASYTFFQVKRSGTNVQYPDLSQSPYTGSVSGATLRLLMPQQFLPATPVDVEVTARQDDHLGVLEERDAVSVGSVTFDPPAHVLGMDVSAFSATAVAMPVVETFTVPHIDPTAVWDAVRATFALKDEDVDAVAIYTSFPNDLDSHNAVAYSTIGNAGVNGIGVGTTRSPRTPALLFMNLAYVPGPLLHEFGHRWGFYVSAKDGASMVALHDGTGHPRDWLDTTAAFTDGSSTLGGSRWLTHGTRLYQRKCGDYGYSWLDLYLMGLARPEEVPPILDVATPAYVGCEQSVTADAKSWTVQQVVDAMGARVPAYADSQKRFAMAWVLMEDPALTFPGASDAVRAYSDAFEEQFRAATGGRGSVVRAFPDQPPRRRSARH